MGKPLWAEDERFKTKPNRVSNWDELYALMSDWTLTQTKKAIADAAQAAHVPSFPLMEVSEHLDAEQLHHRGFFQSIQMGGKSATDSTITLPRPHGSKNQKHTCLKNKSQHFEAGQSGLGSKIYVSILHFLVTFINIFP